jgi:hypothetical protein
LDDYDDEEKFYQAIKEFFLQLQRVLEKTKGLYLDKDEN